VRRWEINIGDVTYCYSKYNGTLVMIIHQQKQPSLIPLSEVGYMNQLCHNVPSYPICRSNTLISRFSLIVSLIVFFRSSFVSSDLTTLHLIYSPFHKIYRSSLYICPNHLSLVSTIFSTMDATPTLSNVVISNSVPSSLTTQPTHILSMVLVMITLYFFVYGYISNYLFNNSSIPCLYHKNFESNTPLEYYAILGHYVV
jgi:hypothetical protein